MIAYCKRITEKQIMKPDRTLSSIGNTDLKILAARTLFAVFSFTNIWAVNDAWAEDAITH
jgi:hypothetical protein